MFVKCNIRSIPQKARVMGTKVMIQGTGDLAGRGG
jgi:hypothetical protein